MLRPQNPRKLYNVLRYVNIAWVLGGINSLGKAFFCPYKQSLYFLADASTLLAFMAGGRLERMANGYESSCIN